MPNTTLTYMNEARTQELINFVKADLAKKQSKIQYSTMPTLTDDNITSFTGILVQYIGTTNADYTNGDFYVADSTDPDDLKWIKVSYNKTEIDAAIAAAGHFLAVATLPATNIKTNTIYLIPKTETVTGYSSGTSEPLYESTGTTAEPKFNKYSYNPDSTMLVYVYDSEVTGSDAEAIQSSIDSGTLVVLTTLAQVRENRNVKEEFLNLDGTSSGWEKIGDTTIDLSNYVKFDDLVAITAAQLESMWNS